LAKIVKEGAESALSVLKLYRQTLEQYERDLQAVVNRISPRLWGFAKRELQKLADYVRSHIQQASNMLFNLELKANAALEDAKYYERMAEFMVAESLENAKRVLEEFDNSIIGILESAQNSVSGYLGAISEGISAIKQGATGGFSGIFGSVRRFFDRLG